MNLACDLERAAESSPAKAAIIFNDRIYSYRDLDQLASSIAVGLAGLGVGQGDRVAAMLPSMPEHVAVFYGVLKRGGLHVAINTQLKEEEVAYLLENSGARVLIVAPAYLSTVEAVRPQLPELEHIVLLDEQAQPGVVSWQQLCQPGGDGRAVQMSPESSAVIFYTSGTTGVPKGAVHSHEGLLVQLEMVAERYSITAEDRFVSVLALYLLSILLLGPMMSVHKGATLYLMERYDPLRFAEIVKRERVTMVGASVPTMFADLAKLPSEEARLVDLSSVRIASCGGSPMPPDLRREFEERYQFRFVHAYGGTEGPAIITTDPLDRERKFDSVGTSLPHIQVRIVDDNDNTLPPGHIGEIITGPWQEGPYAGVYKPLKEYWRMPEATAEALRGGFFHWGDLGYMDEEGFLYIVDRKKDMIIRGGMNVYPAEIEKALYDDARVLECAVVGVPHERLGEVPKVFIRLKPGATASAQEFIDMIDRRLARFKRLEAVEFVPDFPRNALGKILKRDLRDQEVQKARAPQISAGEARGEAGRREHSPPGARE